jgi:hypothetical protein
MNPTAGIHAEVTAKRAQRNGFIAVGLTFIIPLVAIWAVIEGSKLRELGRESAGAAIIVVAVSIAVLRIGLHSAGIWP